ncbi:MAG: hypothetical protein KF709_02475 [Gemmatimonadaceae bacterium]|nr:hypothetical protein [Gemmatimonadaceae bacterium]
MTPPNERDIRIQEQQELDAGAASTKLALAFDAIGDQLNIAITQAPRAPRNHSLESIALFMAVRKLQRVAKICELGDTVDHRFGELLLELEEK